jgi:VWFA-related protein
VIVDVVVTNSQGKPVRGLSAREFLVYEDGTPQQILSFDSHSSASDAEFVPPRLPALPADWFVNLPSGPERGPLFVVLLDLLHIDIEDQPRARKQLQDFIGSKPEGARFAIFALTDTLHLSQGFTEDRKRLLPAVSPRSTDFY